MTDMTGMEGLLSQRLGVAEKKQEILDRASQDKANKFNPLNYDNIEHVDGDTFRLKDSDRRIRVSGADGQSVDTFESQEWAYESNPDREAAHKRALSKLTGRAEWTISREDLLERGKVQAEETKRRINELSQGGNLGYRQTGVDAHGRELGELQDLQTGANPFADYSGREQNAGYGGKFNAEQRVRDLFTGERGEHDRHTGPRSVRDTVTDQPINLLHGAGRMLNEIAQAGSVLTGTNSPTVDAKFDRNRDRLKRFRERFLSPEQLGRERLEEKNAAHARKVYDVNYKENLANGDSENMAKIKAGGAEFGDTVKGLITNPGRILDATIESLPYMIGVGAVGRVVATKAAKAISNKVVKEVALAGGSAEQAAASAAQYIASDAGRKAIGKIATQSGIGTVGITEGLSNSADVYASIAGMSEEEALQSDAYVKLRNEGLEHNEAVQKLAEDAFHGTFLKNVALAAAASAATGAAGFETRLFTGKGTPLNRAAKAAKKAKNVPAKTVKGKIAKGVANTAKFAGPAGLKEAAEETIQSGGGEFLAQLAKFEATGEEVGPGIGAAAGEGAIVGFASGAGMQTVFGGLKALGSANPKAIARAGVKFKEAVNAAPIPESAVPENTAPGTVTPEVEEVINNTEQSPEENFKAVFDVLEKAMTDDAENIGAEAVSAYQALSIVAKNAAAAGTPLSQADEGRLEIAREMAADAMKATVSEIEKKEAKDYTAQDLTMLTLATELGVTVNTEGLSEEQKGVVESTAALNVAFDELAANREAQVENNPGDESNIRRVWNSKFGNGKTLVGKVMRPGLGWYARKMREGMNALSFTTENEKLNSLFSGLDKFIKSQDTYLANAREAVAQKQNVGKFKYVAPNAAEGVAGSPAMLAILEAEDVQMKEIVAQLTARYNHWKAAGQVTPTSAADGHGQATAQAAPEQASKPKAKKTTKGQPKKSKALRKQLSRLEAEHGLGSTELDEKLRKMHPQAVKSGDVGLLKRLEAVGKKNQAHIAAGTTVAPKNPPKAKKNANKKPEVSQPAQEEVVQLTVTPKTIEELQESGTGTFVLIGTDPDLQKGDKIAVGISGGKAQGVVVTSVSIDADGNRAAHVRAAPDAQFAIDIETHGTEIAGITDESSPEGSPAPATQATPAAVAGPGTLRKAVAEGGLQGALDFIIAESKSRGVPAIAQTIKKYLGDRTIPIKHLTQEEMTERFGNKNAKAAYTNGVIYMNTGRLKTGLQYQNSLLHESIHAAIDGWLAANKDSREYMELAKLNREVRLALLADGSKFALAMAKILAGKDGKPAVEELLTHGITTPFLQNFLQNMKVEDETAWSKFVQLIADILGLENTTKLHQVLSITERIFDQANPGTTVTAEADAQAQPEQEAEGVDPVIEEEATAQEKAVRLSEVRRMNTLLQAGQISESEIFLAHEPDLTFLNQLLEGGVPLDQALEQLVTQIEPDAALQNAVVESTVDQESIDTVATNAAILNDRENKTGIEARGIPERWRDFRNIVDGAIERITKIFDEFKLPLKLADAFTTRSSKVRDLLASDDFVMAVLTDPGAREQFFDKIGAKPAEQRALLAFSQFYTAFYNRMDKNIRKVKASDIATKTNGGHGIGMIDENLLPYFTDENGNLDANVVAAMALESMQWLTTRGPQTVSNGPDDVRAMFGLSEWEYITGEMWAAAGQGTVRTQVTSEIGYKSLSHINIKPKPDAKPLIREKLAMAMGAQAVATLADMKVPVDGKMEPLIVNHAVDRNHWLDMMGEGVTVEDTGFGTGDVVLIRNNSIQPAFDSNAVVFPPRIDINTPLREAILEGRDIFTRLFSSTSNVRTPVFDKPEMGDVPGKVSRSLSQIPRLMKERMLIDMQKHYEVDTELLDLIERFDPERFLEMAHGFTPEAELDNHHITERIGLEGKNAGLLRDLNEAASWNQRYGNKAFYLPLKMIRSGRVYIDSNVINPQSSKLHRFMFIREGWKRDIVKQEPSAMTDRTEYEKFMMAIGLGIGIKTENFTRSEVVRQTEAYFQDGAEGREALDAIAVEGMVGIPTDSALARLLAKEGTHSLAALHAYSKWDTAAVGDTVTIAIPNETDGITNGYVAGLMQTPPAVITPEYKALLNAGGIFFEGDPWDNWADYKADRQLDNYQHIANGVRAFLNANKAEADAFTVNKDTTQGEKRRAFIRRQTARVWSSKIVPDLAQLDGGNAIGRDWAKNPLMVTSYGAGTGSVVRAMIASATEKFYENLALARNGTAQDIADAINSAYGIANLVVDANNAAGIKKKVKIEGQWHEVAYQRVGTQSKDGYFTAEEIQAGADSEFGGSLSDLATNFKLVKEVRDLMGQGLAETYGASLAQSLDARLAPVLGIRGLMNQANKFSNVLYTADFNRRVQTLENDRGNRLTPADRQAIREQMMKEGLVPTIGTAASEGLEDSLETTNYENEYYKVAGKPQGGLGVLESPRQLTEVILGPHGKKRVPNQARSLSARITAPQPNSDIGVKAGVIQTHSLDGVNNSAAWGQTDYAVGNVHDAQLSPWWAADDVAGIANADFGNMHASYSSPDQFLRTLLRMRASLYHANDSRLTQQAKDNAAIEMAGYQTSSFGAVDIDFSLYGIDPEEDPVRAGNLVISELVRQLQNNTIDSLEGKKDLFGQIRTISQFAMRGAEANFPDGIELEGTSNWHIAEHKSTRELVSTMRDYLTQGLPIHDKAIEWFKNVLADPEADVAAAFNSYIQHQATDAESTLDLLAAAYGDTILGEQLDLLNNVLKPYLGGVRVVSTPTKSPFAERTRTIHIPADAKNPVAVFMNQAIYAASLPKLREMQESNPEEYAALGKRAYLAGKAMMKSKVPAEAQVGAEIIRYQQLSETPMGIATYLGRTLSVPSKADSRAYELFFAGDTKRFAGLAANLQQALRSGENSTTVLYDEAFNDEDFDGRYDKLLESEKVAKIFADLALLEQTAEDPEHQAHLVELIETLVVPGLTSIAPLLQKVTQNDTNINTGETVQAVEVEGDIIRLQAAGNALSNNVDSSLQEKAANEYVHNIVSHAVDTDHFIRKETRRLFELAKDQLDWTNMLPEEVTGDVAIAEERAKERYDWIFNNPDTAKGYKAFLSIGATNKAFGDALSGIDNPDFAFNAPVWSRGVLRGLMSVVRQAIGLLAGANARQQGGTLADATRALAQATVASNQRNQQRIAEAAEGPGGNILNRANAKVVAAVNERIVNPLGAGLASVQAKRLDPDNPTLPGFLKSATYVALKTRDEEVRREYNKFYRSVAGPNVGKDNSFFEILSEITPWDDTKLGWIDLLRKSKYMVDMARQDATEHTRSFIADSFDKNNHMTKAQKMAITKTILKTDLSSLLAGENSIEMQGLVDLLNDPNAVTAEITRLESILRSRLVNENLVDRFQYFRNQYTSLGQFMRTGKASVGNPMLNANNIAKQYFLPVVSQKAVNDPEIESLIDSLATLHALKNQNPNDLRLTGQIVNHEMAREDATGDNGFTRLIGMQINFKTLAQENLFKDNPVQMIKGYVYEIFDGDVNIKYVQQGSPEEELAIQEGMQLVGELSTDKLDQGPIRKLYKGLRGLNTYNKAVVSLTDLQHRGANLFAIEDFKSDNALQKLSQMRSAAFKEAAINQSKADYARSGENAVPVLNDQGQIVDYRYMMSESNKQSVMKKEDPFDRVLPHMFGSLEDRPATVEVNRKVVDLLFEEHKELKNNPEYRFVEVGRTAKSKEAVEMWRLLPEDMRRYAKSKFGDDFIMIRDDVVNLVLGYRKLSTVNLKDPTGNRPNMWGAATPIVRMAEKVWLEIVSLMRIKIAVLTPAVVVGNMASNTAMLLGEGIPPAYIQKNAAEAISAMRQYQKDRKAATELDRRVGAARALGKDVRQLELKLGRLEADLQANPVGKLVEEGLFTSITSDLGVDDDTIRGSVVQKIGDLASGSPVGKGAVAAVKELYMLPGSKGYKAAVAATQYGDFVARYIKVKYDTQELGHDPLTAIRDALASFIYYDIPQNKYLQAANDFGPIMFTKFFFRIQSVVAKMYSQNPITATSVLMFQRGILPSPFNENIANYGLGTGFTQKPTAPWNLPGKVADTLNPAEPASMAWLFNPLGL